MKQKVLFIILNEYTDWEGAFLSTALHVGVIPGGEIKYEVHTVAPTSDTVCSIGGFRTLPDCSFENMPKDYAALVLIGGNRWDSPEAELVVPLVQEALDKGKIIGAICNGASFLCLHGFLNNVKHTGNGLTNLNNGVESVTLTQRIMWKHKLLVTRILLRQMVSDIWNSLERCFYCWKPILPKTLLHGMISIKTDL